MARGGEDVALLRSIDDKLGKFLSTALSKVDGLAA